MIEIPEYEPDPEALSIQEMFDELTMRRCHEAMAAAERRRARESVHALFMISEHGTKQELYQAMLQAFGLFR